MGFLSDLGDSLVDLAAPIGGVIGFALGGPAGAAAGASIGGAISGQKSEREAGRVTQRQSDAAIAEQISAREAFEKRTQPFADIGLQAGQQLSSFLADPSTPLEFDDPTQQLQNFLADPNQQLAEINPIVDFLRNQGFERIEESAAAGGRLGAGGTLRDLTRFNTQLASTIIPQLQQQKFGQLSAAAQLQQQQQQQEFGRTFSLENQRFNQLFNVTGLGANVSTGQGTAGLQTAGNISNILGVSGQNQAASIRAQNQAILGGVENIGSVLGAFPDLFGSTPPPSDSFNNAPTGPLI